MLRTLLRHSTWNAVATFSHQGSTFATNFLVIKLLDHETYGQYSLVILTAFYIASILQFAVGSTASKYIARYIGDEEQLRSVIWICGAFSFTSGLFGLIILALTSSILARDIFIEPSLAWPLAIASLSVPGLVGMVFLGGLLQGLHRFRDLAISSALSSLLFVIIVTAGAWTGDLTGAIWGFVAGSTFRSLIMGSVTLLCLRGTQIQHFSWRKVQRKIAREIFEFQLPAGLAAFVTVPTLWLIPTILARNTQGFSDVASYSVLIMLKSLIVLPASVISIALQPSAEKACAAQQFDAAMRVFRTSSIAAFASAAIGGLFFAVFAKEALAIFGRSFAEVRFELQLIVVAAVAESVAVSLYMRIQAAGRMWSSIYATLLPRDVTMIVIVTAFAMKYGLLAAILAHVAGSIVNLCAAYWLGSKAVSSLRSSSQATSPS